jgi:hypothetical protein
LADNRKEFYVQKFNDGTLAEAILVKGLPCFLQIDLTGQPLLKEKLELPSMILKPTDKIGYLNKPYEFESSDEIKSYLQRAQLATVDSLFLKTKSIWAKYIDASDEHITICAADTFFTYFQDKIGMCHYLIFARLPSRFANCKSFKAVYSPPRTVGLRYRNPFMGRPHEAYKRPTIRYDGDTPNQPGFTINETWGALKRCWTAYRIAARDRHGKNIDNAKALKYAKRIRKLQFELGVEITEFPELDLFGTEPESVELTCE